MISQFAPAKINLYLHITGRRPDGYHVLDSLTAFAGVGDEIRLEPAAHFDFAVEGPQAALLRDEPVEKNLVVKVARGLAERTGKNLDLRLTLVKNLPVASGIGGGSSDAAAALRALALHWGVDSGDPGFWDVAALGGQDVPVCLRAETCYITEEGTAAGPILPHTDIVLVNPNQSLPTVEVYKCFRDDGFAFSAPARLKESPQNVAELATSLKERGNDLAAPALKLRPVIGQVIMALEATQHCVFARMSGSGATCFGLYPGRDHARKAAAEILEAHPDWWVIQSHIPKHADRRQRF